MGKSETEKEKKKCLLMSVVEGCQVKYMMST